MLSNYF